MSENKKWNQFIGFMPMCNGFPMPPMPFAGCKDDEECEKKKFDIDLDEKIDAFDADMMTYWNQFIEMQRSFFQSSKDSLQQLMKHLDKMQETFEKSLPDELPAIPGLPQAPVKPKESMKQVKKFQEMQKKYITEQADAQTDFYLKSQVQARETAGGVVDKGAAQRKDFVKKEKAKMEGKSAPAKKRTPKAQKTDEPAKKRAPARKRTPKAQKAEDAPAQEKSDRPWEI